MGDDLLKVNLVDLALEEAARKTRELEKQE
jgi:hypothetical protein